MGQKPEDIVTRTAKDQIRAFPAGDLVETAIGTFDHEDVVVSTAVQPIIAASTDDRIVAAGPCNHIITVADIDRLDTGQNGTAEIQGVVASTSQNDVKATTAAAQ